MTWLRRLIFADPYKLGIKVMDIEEISDYMQEKNDNILAPPTEFAKYVRKVFEL